MRKTSNEIKTRLLEIPFGTANNRLKKLLLFSLVQRLNLDICYRCNLEIEIAEELSVEHKNGWQLRENPIEAFFNLEDIGFSHLKCNIAAATNRGLYNKKKNYCQKKHEYTKENTYLDKKNKKHCKICTKERVREIRKNARLAQLAEASRLGRD